MSLHNLHARSAFNPGGIGEFSADMETRNGFATKQLYARLRLLAHRLQLEIAVRHLFLSTTPFHNRDEVAVHTESEALLVQIGRDNGGLLLSNDHAH